jgi:hypothetical protein
MLPDIESGSAPPSGKPSPRLSYSRATQIPKIGKKWNIPARHELEKHYETEPEENDMKKLLILSAVAALSVTSAVAQTSEYYVVRDTSTKKCTIVDKKPTTTTTTVVDNGTFKTRTEAETGMKTMKVCTN